MNHTKASISIGQLLEVAPYCRKRIMAALTSQERTSERPTSTYQVTAKTFDEEMPMVWVIMKTKRIPNALIDGGSGVNIITDALRKKLSLKKITPAPFTIKMVDQRKVMPKGIIQENSEHNRVKPTNLAQEKRPKMSKKLWSRNRYIHTNSTKKKKGT